MPSKIGMYILNEKRKSIAEIEEKLNINLSFQFDDKDSETDCKIERKGSLQMLENPNSTEHSKELKEEPEQQKKPKKDKKIVLIDDCFMVVVVGHSVTMLSW